MIHLPRLNIAGSSIPLDGTTNYVHGLPAFSISVALQREKEAVFGGGVRRGP